MLVVETVARIRRAYFVQEKAIKEIVRELRVSRKVVRKVIRSGETSACCRFRGHPVWVSMMVAEMWDAASQVWS